MSTIADKLLSASGGVSVETTTTMFASGANSRYLNCVTGTANGKELSIVVAYALNSTTGGAVLSSRTSTSNTWAGFEFTPGAGASESMVLNMKNTSGSTQVFGRNNSGHPSWSNWHILLLSVDLTSTSSRQIWLARDGTETDYSSTVTWYTYNNANVAIGPQWSLGTTDPSASASYLNGFAGYVYAIGEYIDFSSSANREKFVDATTSVPVDLGGDGSSVTGSTPLIYSSDIASLKNYGSGGDWTNNNSTETSTNTIMNDI